MTLKEALRCIADGHTFWSLKGAKEICKAFGLKLPNNLIERYSGQKEANPDNDPKGLWLNENKSVEGVSALPLSDYIAEKILGYIPSSMFFGRGFGARANAEAITKKLNTK